MERHNALDDNKDSYYTVDKEKFKKSFIKLFHQQELNKINLIINLHLAYSLTCDEVINDKKIIIINIHHIIHIFEMSDIDYKIILTIRHPIAALCSGIKHWLNYKNGIKTSPWHVYFNIDRQFNTLKRLSLKRAKIHVIALEKLHTKSEKVIKDLIKKLNIRFDYCLLESTYHGKKWWGDVLSKVYLNGLNPNFKNNIDYSFFFKKDVYLLEHYLKPIYLNYNFEISKQKINLQFLKLLPLKIELLILRKEIINYNFKNILSFFYYWFKRIKLMDNSHFKNIKFPQEIVKN